HPRYGRRDQSTARLPSPAGVSDVKGAAASQSEFSPLTAPPFFAAPDGIRIQSVHRTATFGCAGWSLNSVRSPRSHFWLRRMESEFSPLTTRAQQHLRPGRARWEAEPRSLSLRHE